MWHFFFYSCVAVRFALGASVGWFTHLHDRKVERWEPAAPPSLNVIQTPNLNNSMRSKIIIYYRRSSAPHYFCLFLVKQMSDRIAHPSRGFALTCSILPLTSCSIAGYLSHPALSVFNTACSRLAISSRLLSPPRAPPRARREEGCVRRCCIILSTTVLGIQTDLTC